MANGNMDARFQKILEDPRFKKMPKHEKKVKVDSRFSKMFTDDRFHTKSTIDKRGRPIKETEKEDLKKFYEIDDEDEEEENKAETVEEKSIQKVDTKGKGKKKKEKTRKKLKKEKKAKEEIAKEVSDTDSEDSDENVVTDFKDIRGESIDNKTAVVFSSDEDDEEEDILEVEEGIVHGWGELDSDAKRIENAETHRLAVCNCDWDRVTANDLFMLVNSFKPTGGMINSVKIYLSDFGEERLKEEEISGPQELTAIDSDEDSGCEGNTEGSKYHMEKLREYQLNRMKYYYAVVECADKGTADKIYEECDGMEYEMSGTRLDLRFIPEDMAFAKEPKSEVKELPNIKNYEPATFLNTALQQSTVRLTWDESDPKRMQNTMRQFTKEDIENMDFKDYIASSSEDEAEIAEIKKQKNKKKYGNKGDGLDKIEEADEPEEDEEGEETGSDDEAKRIKKYRLLMEEINAKEEANEEDGDMEVMWSMEKTKKSATKDDNGCVEPTAGSESDVSNSIDGESDVEDNDGYHESDEKVSDAEVEDADVGDDQGFGDPFFKQKEADTESKLSLSKNKKKKKKKMGVKKEEDMNEEERKNKRELELLLMGGEEEKKHFSLKGILEQEKSKKKKRKKRKLKEDVVEDDFVFDTKDDRFNALYESHLYSIDPSKPNFKKTKATDAIIKEAQKRRGERANARKVDYGGSKDKKEKDVESNKASLSALVKSVKSKTVSHQLQKKKRKLK